MHACKGAVKHILYVHIAPPRFHTGGRGWDPPPKGYYSIPARSSSNSDMRVVYSTQHFMYLYWHIITIDTPFHGWRIPGVLQRFSITYFVVAITELFTSELYARWKVCTLLYMYMYYIILAVDFHVVYVKHACTYTCASLDKFEIFTANHTTYLIVYTIPTMCTCTFV